MSSTETPRLRRVLKWTDAAAILIGITIGAGIFAVPQGIAQNMSSFGQIIWLWIGCAAFSLVGNLLYAELGTRLPVTGGEYVYMNRCYGPFAGFMFGWAQVFIIRTSTVASMSLITVAYFQYFVELSRWQELALALCIIAAFGYLNYTGIQRASLYQKFSTIVKVAGLLLLATIGLALLPGTESKLGETSVSQAPGSMVGNTAQAFLLVLFTMIGWDRVGYVAGEMTNPRRAIPRALLVGFGTVMVVYIAINVVYHNALGLEAIRQTNRVGVDLATVLMGSVGASFIAVLVMISTTGSMNGTMMSAPRLYYAMAKDGLMFRWLNYVHPKYRTPSRAILLHCIWGTFILVVRGSFETIITGMLFVILIFYAFTTISIFILRRRNVAQGPVFRMPGYPWLPGLYLAVVVGLVLVRAITNWQQSLIDLAFVAAGLPAAAFFFGIIKWPGRGPSTDRGLGGTPNNMLYQRSQDER